MLNYPCLVLDHDDTVVQSEATINYPYFCYILDKFRPGQKITLEEYTNGCFYPGFASMCVERYNFTPLELKEEYEGWKEYVKKHIPSTYLGINNIIQRQKDEGGLICVVSHSSKEIITRDYQIHFNLQPDAVFGWDLPEDQRKPSTYPLEQIMKMFQLRKEQLLVVDDMKPAWEMANKANVKIGFAAWGRKNCPQIVNQMQKLCDYTFFSTKQLEQFLFE